MGLATHSFESHGYLVPASLTTRIIARAMTLYTIVLTLDSENTVAFCRFVISARRGCFQLPGLSVTAAVFFTGVLAALGVTRAVDDISASLCRPNPSLRKVGALASPSPESVGNGSPRDRDQDRSLAYVFLLCRRQQCPQRRSREEEK